MASPLFSRNTKAARLRRVIQASSTEPRDPDAGGEASTAAEYPDPARQATEEAAGRRTAAFIVGAVSWVGGVAVMDCHAFGTAGFMFAAGVVLFVIGARIKVP